MIYDTKKKANSYAKEQYTILKIEFVVVAINVIDF